MRALICSYYAPQTDRDTGSQRVMELIDALVEVSWQVHFVAVHQADTRYDDLLREKGVLLHDGASGIVDLLHAQHVDVAILAYWPVAERYLPLIRRESPHTHVIVESIDLHFLRYVRQSLGSGERVLSEELGSEIIGELNVYAAADAVLAVSEKEAQFISDLVGESAVALPLSLATPVAESGLPCERRRGTMFVGNFRHAPNVEAVDFLCREVWPLLQPSLAKEHPLYVIGSGMTEQMRRLGERVGVHMVGWVPDLQPYLHRSRVAVVPLRHGAGVKGKLLEALAAGTPVVSTSMGVEGLDVSDGNGVLVADSAAEFADAWQRLLTDDALWLRVACGGRALAKGSDKAAARRRFHDVISTVLTKPTKGWRFPGRGVAQYEARLAFQEDQRIMPSIREDVRRTIPTDAPVAVLSEGRAARVRLENRVAWHFPLPDGRLLWNGGRKSAMTDALRALRAKGGRFLVIPKPSYIWLEDMDVNTLTRELGVVTDAEHEYCRILQFATMEPLSLEPVSQTLVVPSDDRRTCTSRPRVLVVGVCLTDQANTADQIVATLDGSTWCEVSQRWAALGVERPSSRVGILTVLTQRDGMPKFAIVNRLLEEIDVNHFDYLVVTDDDVVLPDGFLDGFIDLQRTLGFAVAQPARSRRSSIDHPIVEQQAGVAARTTQFVEIGPVVSFARAAFSAVLPFDLTSPMGWGYENVWSLEMIKRDLRMGIIDATPIDHCLRPPLTNYSWAAADAGRQALLVRKEHLPLDACMRVLEVFPNADR